MLDNATLNWFFAHLQGIDAGSSNLPYRGRPVPSRSKKPGALDLGRRIAAARAYRDLDQDTVAKEVGVRRDTLGRYEKGFIPKPSRAGAAEGAAKATRLPREFFSIDFRELPAMVQTWRAISQGGGLDPEQARLRAEGLIAEIAEDEESALPGSPNEPPIEGHNDGAENPGRT